MEEAHGVESTMVIIVVSGYDSSEWGKVSSSEDSDNELKSPSLGSGLPGSR